MLPKIWRFLTIVLAALSMAAAFCHLLEMPAKMAYSGGQRRRLMFQQTLYVATERWAAWRSLAPSSRLWVLALLGR